MNKKILCVFHEESTPSLVLYKDGFKCYGCGVFGKLEELEGVEIPPKEELESEPPEDLQYSLTRILSLSDAEVRGLTFPADNSGYYIVWPDHSYYKKRFWEPGKGPKYIGARGHTRGLFWARKEGNDTLAIVEGEINALSVAKAMPGIDVVSPGGVGDFTERKAKQQLTSYYRYSTIVVIADADKPGAEAIINTMSVLWANKIKAVGLPMQPDANEVLINDGPGKLKEQIEKAIKGALDKRP
jgi:DNA primase